MNRIELSRRERAQVAVARATLAAIDGERLTGNGRAAYMVGRLEVSLRSLLEILNAGEEPARRCPAAHPDDPTPCDGPAVVTVLDQYIAGADGCEHHAARLLASLERGRVYALPDAPAGAAIRVHKAADGILPFTWCEGAPRTEPNQRSHADNRRKGGAA